MLRFLPALLALGMAAALPLEWAELKTPKAPKFLIANFADWSDRLSKDPWKGMLTSKQSIPAKLFDGEE